MGFGNKFGGGGGGKKGPRAHKGSFKNKAKLRPQPEKPFQDASKGGKGKGRADPDEDEEEVPPEEEEEDDEEEEFTYSRNLHREAKPLEGFSISITGCGSEKSILMELAQTLGATTSSGLQSDTTHLIADGVRSDKYRMALQHKMKIMAVQWLYDVRNAWKNAEEEDYQEIEDKNRFQALSTLHICLTNFARGQHKTDVKVLLAQHGATFHPSLGRSCTHLIVASQASPHSQDSQTKLHEASKMKDCVVVWEGWLQDTIKRGGVDSHRESFWTWKKGGMEPFNEEQEEEGKEESGERANEEKTTTKEDEDDLGSILPPKKRLKGDGKRDLLAVESLIDSFKPGSQPALSRGNSDVDGNEGAFKMTTEAPLDDHSTETKKSKGKGKAEETKPSFIRAIGSSRQFNATSTSTSANPFISTSIDPPPAENEGEGGSWSKMYDGQTFAVVGMENTTGEIISNAIKSMGGQVWLNPKQLREKKCDWVVVPYAGTLKKYRTGEDKRVVTACWIEWCRHAEAFIQPDDRTLERPLPYETPVVACQSLSVHLSKLNEIDSLLLTRFIKTIGAKVDVALSSSTTHLITSQIDNNEELVGPKIEAAKSWGVEIMGVRSFRDWVEELALAKNELEFENNGKEGDGAKVKVENGVLEGCVVALSEKIKEKREQLVANIEALGATVSTFRSGQASSITHAVHVAAKSSEILKEIKNMEMKPFVVHPKWIEECTNANERLSELDYPPTYDPKKGGQLASFVKTSPTRHRSRTPSLLPPSRKPTLESKRSNSSSSSSPTKEAELPDISSGSMLLRQADRFSREANSTSEVPETLSPPPSRQADRIASPELMDVPPLPHVTAASSSPHRRFSQQIPSPNTSSDPVDMLPAKSEEEQQSESLKLLRQQTEVFIAEFQPAPLNDQEVQMERRRSRMGRKRSAVDTSAESSFNLTTDNPFAGISPPKNNAPRRIPGAGFEPSQFSQLEESMMVTYEDPAAIAARANILAAINGRAETVVGHEDETQETQGSAPTTKGKRRKAAQPPGETPVKRRGTRAR